MGRRSTSLSTLIRRVIPSQTKQYNGFPCLEWTGTLDKDGYAQVSYLDKRHRVARLIAHIYMGFDLKSPMFVCHHCDNRKCIEYRHFFIGSPKENTRDGIGKGRIVPFSGVTRNANAEKTECLYGHPYNLKNTGYNKGSRYCRECARLRMKRKFDERKS